MKIHGIDLHIDTFWTAVLNLETGKPLKTIKKYIITEESLSSYYSTLSKDDYVIIESGSNSFWFYDQLKDKVKECFIVNTHKLQFKGNKTDKIDALSLVKYLSFFIISGKQDEIPKVYVPDLEARRLRSLFTTYNLLKKLKNQVSNMIYGILKQDGKITKWRRPYTHKEWEALKDLESDENVKYQLDLLISQIFHIEHSIAECRDKILLLGNARFKDEIMLLMTINGISPFSATALMSDVVNISRFPDAKHYCSYLRTAPSIRSSNNTSHIGCINKQSRALSSSLLNQSMNHFKTISPYFQNFYDRMRSGKSAGKSRVALLRKILVCTYYMLRDKKEFRWLNEKTFNRKKAEYESFIRRISANMKEDLKKTA